MQFIETICKRYLGTSSAEFSTKALIAWEKLCYPKVAGGLKLVNMEVWNKAVVGKLLWNLCMAKEQLWVRCVHAYYIKKSSIWDTAPKAASRVVQKIFKAKRYLVDAGCSLEEFQHATIFSIQKLYSTFHGVFPKMNWRKLVCNNLGCSKWIFMLRLAIVGKLATNDRLAKWGINTDKLCGMCNQTEKSLHNLFFQCLLSKQV